MSDNISPHILSDISKFIASHMGLHFPKTRWDGLERGIESAAQDFGYTDIEEFVRWLRVSPLTKRHIEVLASHLTAGETYFFREKESLEALQQSILPELIGSRQNTEKRLRIWSAGCSTGEEAYSIAITLHEMIADLKDWNITILATDINPDVLNKASAGVYTEWSFRNTPGWLKQRYFKMTKQGRYEILPPIKKMAMFAYLNLAEDVYPSLFNNTNAMDLIFCRNVLMYFSGKRAKKVVKGFYNCLVDNGWLIVSPVEAFIASTVQFAAVNFPGAVLYRKRSEKIRSAGNIRSREQRRSRAGEHGGREAGAGELRTVKKHEIEKPDLYMQARVMFEQGRYAEASEELTRLFSQSHGEPKIIALLARVCANQGKLDEAAAWCKKAISVDTLNPAYYYLLATILQEQGRVDEAVDSLKKALYLDHNFVIAYFALANIMAKKGKLKASRKYLKNAADLLSAYRTEQVIPESEGITAGRLSEIIESMRHR